MAEVRTLNTDKKALQDDLVEQLEDLLAKAKNNELATLAGVVVTNENQPILLSINVAPNAPTVMALLDVLSFDMRADIHSMAFGE